MSALNPPKWTPEERAAWRPPEQLTVTEWADAHRYLDSKTSAEPGKFSSSRTPYAREWMDSANCAWVRQVTIIAGTQSGKTETLNNVLGYAIHQDPGPAMMVLPRNPDVRLAKQRRVLPMIEATPVLRDELTDHDHDLKNVELAFRRAIVYLRSSQSPADLASVPVRYLFADEVDKYPRWSGDEASPLDLARERQKTFWNRIAYVTTTPTTPDAPGWSEFEAGDRRRYHVPCPDCGGLQVLEWAQFRYPKDATAREVEADPSVVAYVCKLCGVVIPDSAKPTMLENGAWVPEGWDAIEWIERGRAADRETWRSYHLSSFYSPWLKWADVVVKWLQSKDKPESLQNYVNSWLAEPWQEQLETPTETDVERAKVKGWLHAIGKPPRGVLVATAGVDVQKDGMWVVVRGWGWNGHTWLLFAGKVETWAQLADVLFRNAWTDSGAAVRAGFIDSRHRRAECIEFVREHRTMKLAQGVDRTSPLDFTSQKLDKHPDTGQPLKQSVLVWSITVARFKDQHAEAMRDAEHWHVPEDVAADYCRQVLAEQKVRKRVRGKMRDLWVLRPGHKANHLLDCEVYATAAGKLIHVERLRRPDGTAGDGDAAAGRPPAAPPPPAPPRRPPPQFPSLQNRRR